MRTSDRNGQGQHPSLSSNPLNAFVPPHDLMAEMSVLGSMLLGDATAIDTAGEVLVPADFYRAINGEVFAAILAIQKRGEPVDIVILKDELVVRGTYDKNGLTLDYLMQTGSTVFTTANVATYAKIVSEKSRLRQLIEVCRDGMQRAFNSTTDAPDVIEMMETKILELRDGNKSDRVHGEMLNPLLSQSLEAFDFQQNNPGVTGIRTGFRSLDYMLSGFQRGDLIVLAGRPSMGKSAIAAQFFITMCRNDLSPVMASLEMNRRQICQRIVCTESRVNSQHIRSGIIGTEEWNRLSAGVERLWNRRGMIDDNVDATVGYLRGICRRHKAKHGLDALFVDYMQLMKPDPTDRRSYGEANRNLEMTAIAEGLKGLARKFDIPVIALAQLSRAVEHRSDKRPIMSDLRDSGAIEAAADVVMFPFREAYYKAKEAAKEGELVAKLDAMVPERCELIIDKQRMGPTGSAYLNFTAAFTRFDDIAPELEPSDSYEFDPEGVF